MAADLDNLRNLTRESHTNSTDLSISYGRKRKIQKDFSQSMTSKKTKEHWTFQKEKQEIELVSFIIFEICLWLSSPASSDRSCITLRPDINSRRASRYEQTRAQWPHASHNIYGCLLFGLSSYVCCWADIETCRVNWASWRSTCTQSTLSQSPQLTLLQPRICHLWFKQTV